MDDLSNMTPPELMYRLVTGFWVSQAVGVAAELGLADLISERASTADELARATGTDPDALFRLLRALSSVGVFRQAEGGRFVTTPLGEALRSGVPGSVRDMAVALTARGQWLPWGRLRDAVRTGERQTVATLGEEIFEHYAQAPDEAAAFAGAMNGLASIVALDVARVVDVSDARVAVDVGGSHGTLLAAVLRANPALSGVLVDLPHVIEGARAAMESLGCASRCTLVAGDFFASVPPGDVYLLKEILHDWDDDRAVAILENCRKSMTPAGRVLVVEMVIAERGQGGWAELVDLNMLVMLPGRERTLSEYEGLFERAGLRLTRRIETLSPFLILEASPR